MTPASARAREIAPSCPRHLLFKHRANRRVAQPGPSERFSGSLAILNQEMGVAGAIDGEDASALKAYACSA